MGSSLISVIRTLGRSSGIALLGALWTGRVLLHAGLGYTGDATIAPVAAQIAGLQDAFLVVAAIALVALGLIIWDGWQARNLSAHL